MSQVTQAPPFQTVPVKPAPAKTTPAKTTPAKTTPLMRRGVLYAALSLVFFLLGFLPLWVKFQENASRLLETERSLRLAQMQNALGSAVIDAQHADYEPALLSVSSFFTSLQAEIDRGDASTFSLEEQAALRPILSGRDEIIALVARGEPAAAARLSDLYRSYSQILIGTAAPGVEARAMGTRKSAQAEQVPGKTSRDQD
jgi:hypothetical protein